VLRLLLDEHISHKVAIGFSKQMGAVPIEAIDQFEKRRLAGVPDEIVLEEATRLGFTLVTYDVKTIPPLLRSWGEQGRSHAGVILIDDKTVPSDDFTRLIRSLNNFAGPLKDDDWTNRVVFLRD
jgi:hypothetical protein